MRFTTVTNVQMDNKLFRLDSEYFVGIHEIDSSYLQDGRLHEVCDKIVQGPALVPHDSIVSC